MIRIPVEEYHVAGLFEYLGYRCVGCDTTNPRSTVFSFLMPHQASHDELCDAWMSLEGQPLSSGRHYAEALKRLDTIQRKARLSQFRVWDCPEYLAGKI